MAPSCNEVPLDAFHASFCAKDLLTRSRVGHCWCHPVQIAIAGALMRFTLNGNTVELTADKVRRRLRDVDTCLSSYSAGDYPRYQNEFTTHRAQLGYRIYIHAKTAGHNINDNC